MIVRSDDRPFEILLVEDNAGDVVLIREAMADSNISLRLTVASNGEEGLSRLRRQGEFAHAAAPDLILLDLNLPRLGGRELLAAIKTNERLRRIPVVVLTSSQAEQDITASYDLHANCYVTKPADLEEFLGVIQSVTTFWLTVAKLPKGE